MTRTKRALAILSANAVVLAFGIAVIELAFGAWLGTNKLNRLNLIRDCVLKYDVSAMYDVPNPIITYSRDRYGLRGSHATPSSIDILTVGGSTTDQRYIRDGETWQDVLQRRFEKAGRTVIVANAGVDGQSTFGHAMNFKWWFPNIPGLAPDYVLFYVGLNDFYIDVGDEWDHLLGDDRSFSLSRTVSENSALWHLARTLRGMYRAEVQEIRHRSTDFQGVEWTPQALQNDYGFMKPRLDAYARRLRILSDMTQELGAKPIFVSQPSRKYRLTPQGIEGLDKVSSYGGHQVNGVDYCHMMKRLDRVTEAVSIEKGARFVDLASHADWDDADFYDFEHMTPQGAEKVGNLLYDALRREVPEAEASRNTSQARRSDVGEGQKTGVTVP